MITPHGRPQSGSRSTGRFCTACVREQKGPDETVDPVDRAMEQQHIFVKLDFLGRGKPFLIESTRGTVNPKVRAFADQLNKANLCALYKIARSLSIQTSWAYSCQASTAGFARLWLRCASIGQLGTKLRAPKNRCFCSDCSVVSQSKTLVENRCRCRLFQWFGSSLSFHSHASLLFSFPVRLAAVLGHTAQLCIRSAGRRLL